MSHKDRGTKRRSIDAVLGKFGEEMSLEIKASCMGKREFSNRVKNELLEGLTNLFLAERERDPHPLFTQTSLSALMIF